MHTCIPAYLHTYIPTMRSQNITLHYITYIHIHTYKHSYITWHDSTRHDETWPYITYIHACIQSIYKIHTYTHIHTHKHTYIHTYVHTYIRTYVPYLTLTYLTLPYLTWHDITHIHYITLHCSTLHYVTSVQNDIKLALTITCGAFKGFVPLSNNSASHPFCVM